MWEESDPIKKKAELLRPLERTVDQFDDLIDWPYPGEGSTPKGEGVYLDDPDAAEGTAGRIGDSGKFEPEQKGLPCSKADGEYTDKDKEFMESFKKIYHLGLNQLQEFISKITTESKDISEDTILYYMYLLLNGPLGGEVVKLTKGQPGWKFAPDIMGANGNEPTGPVRTNSSSPNIPGIAGAGIGPLNAGVDTYRKCPRFIRKLLLHNTINVQGVYTSNFQQLVWWDNTLPQIDKKINERVQDEAGAGHNKKPHGNIGVKDVEFFHIILEVYQAIFDKVEEFLGEEDFRLYVFKKTINYFNPEKNQAESENETILRILNYITRTYDDTTEGAGKEEISTKEQLMETDLFGNTFDSIERREFELGTAKGKFKLYTVKGQLGSGKDPKVEDLIKGCKI